MGLLEKPIYNLLVSERFYANFILGCRLVQDDPKVDRAAIGVRNKEVSLFINPEWFQPLTEKQKVAVLKHEVLHGVLLHIGPRRGDITNHSLVNIAMDCAINQFIQDLPGDCVSLESVEKMCKKKLLPKESWEYYYKEMYEVAEKIPAEMIAEWLKDHDKMNESEMSEIEKIIMRDKINQAVKASAGKIPDGLESAILSFNGPAKVNWKQQLRNFVASSIATTTRNTNLKTHRRFELDQPGKKKKRNLVLGVCLDSSGSVSDESFAEFMREVKTVAKWTSITYLVHADCEVQKVDTIKGGKAKSGVLGKRHGNGGTAYQPALTKCKELKCDAILYFGDMDAADVPENPKIPVLWVAVGTQNPPGDFGRTIRL